MKNLMTLFIFICSIHVIYAQKKKNKNGYTYTNGKVINFEGDTTEVRFRVDKKGIRSRYYSFVSLDYRKMNDTKMLTANVENTREMFLIINGKEERFVPCDIRYHKKVTFFRTLTQQGELNVIPIAQALNMGETVERSTGKSVSHKTKAGDSYYREEMVHMRSYMIRNDNTNETIILVGIKFKKMMNKILDGCPEALELVNLDKESKKERNRNMRERANAGEHMEDIYDDHINRIIDVYNQNCGN